MSLQALKKAHDAVIAVSRKVDALCAAVDELKARVAAMEAPASPETIARDVADTLEYVQGLKTVFVEDAQPTAPKRRGRPPKESQA